jgi:hypothetical protein
MFWHHKQNSDFSFLNLMISFFKKLLVLYRNGENLCELSTTFQTTNKFNNTHRYDWTWNRSISSLHYSSFRFSKLFPFVALFQKFSQFFFKTY